MSHFRSFIRDIYRRGRSNVIAEVQIKDRIKLLCDKYGGKYEPHAYIPAGMILDIVEIHRWHLVCGADGIIVYDGEFEIE